MPAIPRRTATRLPPASGTDLDDCKAKFKAAWAALRAGLTEEDIALAQEMRR